MNTNNYSVQLLTKTLDALPDGILIVSAERQIVYCNNRFREMWKIPIQADMGNENKAILAYALALVRQPESFIAKVEELHLSTEAYEDEISLRDARVFQRRSVSLEDEKIGRCRIWIFTDITSLKQSEFDPLTGLLNRNKFEAEFSSNNISAPDNSLTGVALLDFDNFKLFNDSFGHAAGDEALRRIGSILRQRLQRQSDRGYRIGGDEILLACHGRSAEFIVNFLESIRRDIAELELFDFDNQRLPPLSVSIGLVICRGDISPESIYREADALLYEAKAKGKNHLCWKNKL